MEDLLAYRMSGPDSPPAIRPRSFARLIGISGAVLAIGIVTFLVVRLWWLLRHVP